MSTGQLSFEARKESTHERIRNGPLWIYSAYPKALLNLLFRNSLLAIRN